MTDRWMRRAWPLLVVIALVIGVALLSLFAHSGFHHVPVHMGHTRHITQASPKVGSHAKHVGGLATTVRIASIVVGVVLAGIAIAAIVIAGYVIIRWFPRLRLRIPGMRQPTVQVLTHVRDEVVAALDAGIADLTAGSGDPRAAVIACWVRLEQVAAAAGTPRQPGDTPGDLVGRLLGAHRVSRTALTQLADLYRTARYSPHLVDPRMRDQARDALGRLRAELAPPPAAALRASMPSASMSPASTPGRRR